ncbi:hypothetical protein BC834DRAFT_852328 [Gloeopeniophorella convolvens]|nr:hypothetical protein BC834DRAFT_852328 [Gloeopeniophorella convolvens]
MSSRPHCHYAPPLYRQPVHTSCIAQSLMRTDYDHSLLVLFSSVVFFVSHTAARRIPLGIIGIGLIPPRSACCSLVPKQLTSLFNSIEFSMLSSLAPGNTVFSPPILLGFRGDHLCSSTYHNQEPCAAIVEPASNRPCLPVYSLAFEHTLSSPCVCLLRTLARDRGPTI